jgi:hypothetical protein
MENPIPATEHTKVPRLLDEFNPNAYPLFGSEDSLIETPAVREIDLRQGRSDLIGKKPPHDEHNHGNHGDCAGFSIIVNMEFLPSPATGRQRWCKLRRDHHTINWLRFLVGVGGG